MAAAAEFYDQILDDPAARSLAPLEQSPWLPLYAAAARLIAAGANVVDLGCGTGRFAKLLNRPGRYVGIDFSPASIREATAYAPGCDFRVGDLRVCEIPAGDVYVALEVLEHLDDDLELLQRLPDEAQVVISVPSFDSAAHERVFPTLAAARDRYAAAVEITTATTLPLSNRKFWHLLAGSIRHEGG